MKKESVRTLFFAAISVVMCISSVFAQGNLSARRSSNQKAANVAPAAPLLVEDFPYAPGSLLTDNGWAAHSASGTNALATVSPGLTLAGYPGSGIGNAVAMGLSGEDVNRTFAVQSTGSVYAAFLVNVSDASTTAPGGYFFHFGPDPIGSTFRGRVFATKDGSNNLAFGISVAATTAAGVALTPYSYSLNTTYLIVVKYNIVDGEGNDTAELFVSTTVPGTEPAATVTSTDTSPSDISPGSIALRQGSSSTAPTLHIDGIRVGTSWADVTQSAPASPAQHIVDFNGDGKTDYAVVRNSGGGPTDTITWFECYSTGASQECTGNAAADFGVAVDWITPADFDGDSKTDIAVWREGPPETAAFYILQSSDSTLRIDVFGQSGDDPSVVADYTGDGKADPAVYRSGINPGEQSYWFYRASSGPNTGAIVYNPWGTAGDYPAPGDYDGDGKGDFMVQRDGGAQAVYWLNASSDGAVSTIYFGQPSNFIIPGDYDGDGKTDLAVFQISGGNLQWYVRKSSAPDDFPYFATWGLPGDSIVQGDYDGDGKTDVAVWRPNNDPTQNYFYVRSSATGSLIQTEWGIATDYPVANYNVH
ncbi:MAG: IPT/TIG domain, FG-GAP repeat-containing protein [Acidobacteria bacterium OLB17]|nr:MAG: IPT/TIG domain, FG-GAP repeat-containing protein [Acidobacteria bacterium OLB17]MCZ2391761.1 VCBS repeat-containing protein [Acidobacteriota bacterium]